MTKTFCDRCGKEITKKYGWLIHRQLYASMRLLPGKEHTEWSDRNDLCICMECEDSYIRWFMHPETDTGSEVIRQQTVKEEKE